MSDVDELFDVKNAFYTGNFQGCIKEAQSFRSADSEAMVEKDTFMYRSYIALKKFGIVRDEIRPSESQASLLPLKTLADYLSGNTAAKEKIYLELETAVNGGTFDAPSCTHFLMAATIFVHEGNYEAALRLLNSAPSDHLECMAMRLQTLLKMNRTDLAKKELKSMQEKDDDAILTQLAQAWINMELGGEKIQDAYYIYQELIDKFGSTPLLLNGQAASFLAQGKYEEAESALQEAMEKDTNNADTLINLVVLSQHTGKPPEVCNRYLTQLKDDHANHPFMLAYHQREKDFEHMVSQYSQS